MTYLETATIKHVTKSKKFNSAEIRRENDRIYIFAARVVFTGSG